MASLLGRAASLVLRGAWVPTVLSSPCCAPSFSGNHGAFPTLPLAGVLVCGDAMKCLFLRMVLGYILFFQGLKLLKSKNHLIFLLAVRLYVDACRGR